MGPQVIEGRALQLTTYPLSDLGTGDAPRDRVVRQAARVTAVSSSRVVGAGHHDQDHELFEEAFDIAVKGRITAAANGSGTGALSA